MKKLIFIFLILFGFQTISAAQEESDDYFEQFMESVSESGGESGAQDEASVETRIQETLVVVDLDEPRKKEVHELIRAKVVRLRAINAEIQKLRANADDKKEKGKPRNQVRKQRQKIEALRQEKRAIMRETRLEFEKKMDKKQIERFRGHMKKRNKH